MVRGWTEGLGRSKSIYTTSGAAPPIWALPPCSVNLEMPYALCFRYRPTCSVRFWYMPALLRYPNSPLLRPTLQTTNPLSWKTQPLNLKLRNLLKRDIMAFTTCVPQSVDCRPPTNGPLHLMLTWLTENISTTTELLPINSDVITLFFRVLPLFKGVTLTGCKERHLSTLCYGSR